MSKENTARNKRIVAERHAARMHSQAEKAVKVPRGTARNERRKPLQVAYAQRLVNGS